MKKSKKGIVTKDSPVRYSVYYPVVAYFSYKDQAWVFVNYKNEVISITSIDVSSGYFGPSYDFRFGLMGEDEQ
jgi:hypothetical protein